jgi:hypothetical protein
MRTTTTIAATLVEYCSPGGSDQQLAMPGALTYLSGLIAARSASFTRAGIGSLRDGH